MSQLPVADAHVDVLMRMMDEGATFYESDSSFTASSQCAGSTSMQASYANLRAGGVYTQVFALYISPRLPVETQLVKVLQAIDLFHGGVVQAGSVRFARTIADLQVAHQQGEIAGLLSLEGAGCLVGRADILRALHRLGVRGIGLTWNPANNLADGCMEPRNAGLTDVGRDIVRAIAELPMWLDLAHLGDASVSDVLSLYNKPVMASHANARAVHPHRRNLPDAVIREVIRRSGWMGLTFESSFLGEGRDVSLDHLARHIDHVLALGGVDCLGFGSDFDGGITPPPGVETAARYERLASWLCGRYGTSVAENLLYRNFHRFVAQILD